MGFEPEVLVTAASSEFSEMGALSHYSFLGANIQFRKSPRASPVHSKRMERASVGVHSDLVHN